MSGKRSKRKGAGGEREWASYLRSKGFKDARRGVQYSGIEGEDVVGLEGIHIEVKRVEALRLYPSIKQSIEDAKSEHVPIVAHRKNREDWVVIMMADDFIELYKNARKPSPLLQNKIDNY